MKVYDNWMDIDNGGYSKFVALKKQNPQLKTLIALGGWNDSAFSNKYSQLVSNATLMENFVSKAVQFVQQVNRLPVKR